MNIDGKVEQLEIISKFLSSQISQIDDRLRTIEIAVLNQQSNYDYLDKKTRSKLDYLLSQIHQLRKETRTWRL